MRNLDGRDGDGVSDVDMLRNKCPTEIHVSDTIEHILKRD